MFLTRLCEKLKNRTRVIFVSVAFLPDILRKTGCGLTAIQRGDMLFAAADSVRVNIQ